MVSSIFQVNLGRNKSFIEFKNTETIFKNVFVTHTDLVVLLESQLSLDAVGALIATLSQPYDNLISPIWGRFFSGIFYANFL